MLYVRVGILLACVKLLYDRIISLRGEIFDRKTNLTWPLFKKGTVSTKESGRLYISVLGKYLSENINTLFKSIVLFLRFFNWILDGIFLIILFV
jgi:hypothetical protein